jgi:hypothetical protein
MTQATKKTTAQTTTKLSAVETTRNSAETVVKMGGSAVKNFMETSAEEAQKAQEKIFAMSREGAAKMAESADSVSKAFSEAVEMSRENMESCIESANLAASMAQDISSEMMESANKASAEMTELSKDMFACRTLSDIMELQNRMIKSSIDNFFNQSVKMSGKMFEYSSEALEPLNERFAQTAEKMTKTLAGKK